MSKRKVEDAWDEDEYDSLPYPDSPDPVRQGVFIYGGLMEEFLAKGLSKGYPHVWRTHLFPAVDTPAAHQIRSQTLTRAYVTSQFEHYGISYDPKMRKDQLISLMERSLHDGKFDTVDPSVLAIEETMREEYKRRCAAYDAALQDRECMLTKRRATEYSRGGTLSEKANLDALLFVKEYFLDSAGNPDPTKKPSMMRMDGLSVGNLVGWRATQVPGLHFHSYYHDLGRKGDEVDGNGTVIFIGWDKTQVEAAGAELRALAQAQDAKAKLDKLQNWHDEHLRYQARAADATVARKKNTPPMFGKYLVRCPVIEEAVKVENGLYLLFRPLTTFADNLGPKPQPMVFEAVFDFELIKGTMLLCEDHATLLEYCTKNLSLHIRQDGATPGVSGPGKNGENPRLHKAVDGKPPRLYHLFWAGIDTEDGSVCTELDDGLHGRIMFGDGFTTFGGEIDFNTEDAMMNTIDGADGTSFFGGGKVSDFVACDDEGIRVFWDMASANETDSETSGGFEGWDEYDSDELDPYFEGDSDGMGPYFEGDSSSEDSEDGFEELL